MEATAISGPACNNKVSSASRDNVEPATFVNVSDGCPNSLTCTSTWRLSAVSPLWLKKMKNGFSDKIGML